MRMLSRQHWLAATARAACHMTLARNGTVSKARSHRIPHPLFARLWDPKPALKPPI
jgi:hypothetical protein